jgi:short subunit dehydrogenase-like uncharacterized protein
MAAPPVDVLVWGATGYTGRLVAEHLARSYTGKGAAAAGVRPVTWALGGRNPAKLAGVRDALATSVADPAVKDVPLVIADAADPAGLAAAVRGAKVVLTTAGPYAKLGGPLLAACVAEKAHYVDLTAEVPWMCEMRAKHGEEAVKAGVKVVHCGGFDSVPSDVLTFMLADTARKNVGGGAPCVGRVTTIFEDGAGGVSGGTVESLLAATFEAPADARRAAADPYALVDADGGAGAPRGPPPSLPATPAARAAEAGSLLPAWCEAARTHTAPFVMAFINTRVTRRSAALRPDVYGKWFRSSEVQAVPGRVAGAAVSAGMAFFGAVASTRVGRALIRKVAPKQGEGPSPETRAKGFWKMRAVAECVDPATGVPTGRRITGRAADLARDPGYFGTARLMLETGLSLIGEDGARAEADGAPAGGVLTPAAAGGWPLVERLRKAGMVFEVEEA